MQIAGGLHLVLLRPLPPDSAHARIALEDQGPKTASIEIHQEDLIMRVVARIDLHEDGTAEILFASRREEQFLRLFTIEHEVRSPYDRTTRIVVLHRFLTERDAQRNDATPVRAPLPDLLQIVTGILSEPKRFPSLDEIKMLIARHALHIPQAHRPVDNAPLVASFLPWPDAAPAVTIVADPVPNAPFLPPSEIATSFRAAW